GWRGGALGMRRRGGGGPRPGRNTSPGETLPDRKLGREDVVSARLPVALRGYRFAETDLLLDRLTDELRQRDDEIARLRGARPSVDGLASTQEMRDEQPSHE